jgi:nicotinamidase-related amidase
MPSLRGGPPPMHLSMTERFAAVRSALLIVDMQKDFCAAGFGAERLGRDISAARAVIPRIQVLRESARSAGVLVVHVAFCTLPGHASDSGPWLAQRRRSTASGDSLCIAGTPGFDFIDELTPADGELVVEKHRYSAFTGTSLDMKLRANRIESLVITGVSTNACVESTARAGCELDYYICVPPDAVGSWDRRLHETTLQNIDHRFGVTLPTADITSIWAHPSNPRGMNVRQ